MPLLHPESNHAFVRGFLRRELEALLLHARDNHGPFTVAEIETEFARRAAIAARPASERHA